MSQEQFQLVAPYQSAGDQIKAIEQLTQGLIEGKPFQVLLGATGTGKTFTISSLIANVNRPTLVLVHNKTLAGQLYNEFRSFFPHNRVEYFVSNFDYYQPEAYMPRTDTYIEKSATINQELDMLRLSTINSILTRRDTIVVASVACIYASSDPSHYRDMFFTIRVNEILDRDELISMLVLRQYTRNDMEIVKGHFRVKGDVIDIALGYTDAFILRIEFFDNTIDRIVEVDPITYKVNAGFMLYNIFPATEYARFKPQIMNAAMNIELELEERLIEFKKEGKLLEAQRLEQRTRYDLEALREFGYCSGIENYSMHIDARTSGQRPYTIFDFFPEDFLFVVDESHASLPQVRGMFNGDQARKKMLVDYGFRLPSALHNRPLRFEEFLALPKQTIYVSATPGDFELNQVNHNVVEQIIRPTGLVDPIVEVKPSYGQIDDLIEQIGLRKMNHQRVLVTTLTVKMAEELTSYFLVNDISAVYLHHETKTLERIEIIRQLRKGKYDVVVGINLLREGLDIPEVSLIAILDADKEGFLRSSRSLIQIIGRAARNVDGKVIMYADRMTDSMIKAIGETDRRRSIQEAHNIKHHITPKTIIRDIAETVSGKENEEITRRILTKKGKVSSQDKVRIITQLEKEMLEAAKVLDFERAALIRDALFELKGEL